MTDISFPQAWNDRRDVSPQLAQMAASTRKASDVALAQLLAQLDDSEAALQLAVCQYGTDLAWANAAVRELERILLAKQRLDAARLAEAPDPLDRHNGMVDQTNDLEIEA